MERSPPNSNIPSPSPNHAKASKRGLFLGLGIGMAVGVIILGFVSILLPKWRRNKVQEESDFDLIMDDEFEKSIGPKKFCYNELEVATNNFAEGEKLGQGGFGGIYRGYLKDLNSYVAVKRISGDSKQGIKEYATEVKIISQLRHRNLVQLIGWCHKKKNLFLIWELRFPSLQRKKSISDMAIEVVLEIVGGRKPIDLNAKEGQETIVERIWGLYGLGEAVDPELCGLLDEQQMELLVVVGLWCAHPDCSFRPSKRQVIQVLNLEVPLPILPQKMPVSIYLPCPAMSATFSSILSFGAAC